MTNQVPRSISERRLDKVPNLPERHKPIGFMLRLVKALHTYGVPAYELESLMTKVADQLEYGVQVSAVPTSITMTFMQEEENPQTYVIRSNSGEVNVDKLRSSMDVAYAVINDDLTAEQGAKELLEISKSKPVHNKYWMVFCFSSVSASIARIFNGGWQEVVAATFIGFIVGLIVNNSPRIQSVSSLMPALCAFIASFISFAFSQLLGLHSTYIPIVAGIIVLVPGLMLTIAMAELATQNLVSGTSRLLGAGMIFIQMAFGVAIGSQLAAHLFQEQLLPTANALPDWTLYIALLVTSWSFMVLFQTRWKELPWIIIATFVAFFVSKFGVMHFGAATGAFLGALSVGLFSNIAYRIKRVPTAAIMMPGFIILVPGSVGFKSLTAILDHDIIGGIEIAFSMVITGISLVTGLLISSIATLPKPKAKKIKE
ncbi:threonine/serine exporter ThrE family protein [Kangiella sp. HZ709]|uniref:threonine/serine ThrE exporter family protein n=1 Tax=Kangiella sp. HZ709 TaxID=2666328 RepID=UPI0012AFCA24|nr:threonine/serine exporter family protein [Kangiella sp. HZ709]MRX27903.1 threonine/serine exporter family protein [Kangiella sp. HZ709]